MAEFHLIHLQEVSQVIFRVGILGQHVNAAHLSHRLDNEDSRHHRFFGKMPREERLVHGHVLDTHHLILIHIDDFVNQQERRPVRQDFPDGIDVERRRGRDVEFGQSFWCHFF